MTTVMTLTPIQLNIEVPYVSWPVAYAESLPERAETIEIEETTVPTLWKTECVLGLRYFGVSLPPAPFNADMFVPNSTPFIGAVAIFRYGDLSHVAEVTYVGDHFRVRETNYEDDKYGERDIEWNSSNLVGFWSINNVKLSNEKTNLQTIQ